jgi:hypothetical protein
MSRAEGATMTRRLTPAQLEAYERDGYVFPLRAISAAEAVECRRKLEAFESATGGPLRGELRHKTHLLFPWLADLVRHEGILDAVEDIHGPNLLCWSTNFFIKEAASPTFVSWHQDSTYWGLSSPDVVTAWVAFTPAMTANGAMQFIPGTHHRDQIPHRDTFAKDNLLTRGQEVMVEVDGATAVTIALEPGQMSLHHVRLVHGSPPNPSADRRIGLAIRYIPTRVRPIAGADSATLVRGVDDYGHFELEPPPRADMDAEAVALHHRVTERNAQILYRGTTVKSHDDKGAVGRR